MAFVVHSCLSTQLIPFSKAKEGGDGLVKGSIPTNAHGECSLAPIPALNNRHLSRGVGARTIKYLMRMTVFGSIEVGVRMRVGGKIGMGVSWEGRCIGHVVESD